MLALECLCIEDVVGGETEVLSMLCNSFLLLLFSFFYLFNMRKRRSLTCVVQGCARFMCVGVTMCSIKRFCIFCSCAGIDARVYELYTHMI